MQMEQKVIDARKISKQIMLMVLILFINSIKVFSQNEDNEFQINFIKTIHYPEYLKNSCTPVFANLLIDVSEKGLIRDLLISDSAPQIFKDEFENEKKKLNIQLLEKIIAARNLKNCGILIPIFYVYGQDYCTNSFADFISNKYLTFESRAYTKLTISLEPIFLNFYRPVH
jgi:hypothetical protein